MSYIGYIGAPYNFIPFNKKVLKYEGQIPGHDNTGDELISGEIAYSITAETPIFVGSGLKGNNEAEEFYKDIYGRYAVPGSSVRGLVRSNVQILSSSSFADDIDDYHLMYRKVTGRSGDALKIRYNELLGSKQEWVGKSTYTILENVKAGYIQKSQRGGKEVFTIYGTVEDNNKRMNYYVLSERTIAEDVEGGKGHFNYVVRNIELQHNVENGFYDHVDQKGRVHYLAYLRSSNGEREKTNKDVLNKKYNPFRKKCSFTNNGRTVTSVDDPEKLNKKGYLVGTGQMKEKKALYLIPEIDVNTIIVEIPDKDIEAFQIDLNRRETSLKHVGGVEWFGLPKDDKPWPVFYILLGGRVYFGYTPRLRIFYDNSIKEGLYEDHKKSNIIDYAKALFGYSKADQSRKSRVSFGDAVLQNDVSEKSHSPVSVILSEPKPTSYLDYIKGGQNYNDDDFELRGVKQYWLKEEVYKTNPGNNTAVASQFVPLPKGSTFTGKIRFHNLKREELGLLVWGLYLSESSQQNIGKAKPYGYGRISVNIKAVRSCDTENAYNLTELSLDPWKEEDWKGCISSYKEKLCELLGLKNVNELERNPSIRTLLRMKENIPSSALTRYMSIDNSEYQSRTQPLPTVEKVVSDSRVHDGTKNMKQNLNTSSDSHRNSKTGLGNYAFGGKAKEKEHNSLTTSMGELLKGIKLDNN